MKLERIDMGTVTVLRLEGNLDEEGVDQLRSALYDCMRQGRFQVVMNLRDAGFLSYMGLGVLVERVRRFRACGGDLKLVKLSLYAERLFRMTGILPVFEIYETESQAVGVFQRAA